MTRLDTLRVYYRENGLLLSVQRASGAALRRTRDHFLARRLGNRGLRLGKDPRLAGLAHMQIGENLSAGNGLWLDAITSHNGRSYNPVLTIGSDCNFSDFVHIACTHSVTLGRGVLCGSHVIISDHAHGIYVGDVQSSPSQRPAERPLSEGRVVIGDRVWIGDGVAILAGAQIGDGAILGANSVVNGLVPANTIVAGGPARALRTWHEASGQWLRVEKLS